MADYLTDIRDQPEALRRLVGQELPAELKAVRIPDRGRITFTGMGTSLQAAYPAWRRMVRAGFDAWLVSAAELLELPELVAGSTLLVITSQSGRSAEVVALLEQCPPGALVLAVTNDAESPLAAASTVCLDIRAGHEATVSTKSYLNSLAGLQMAADVLLGLDPEPTRAAVAEGARAVAALISQWDIELARIAGPLAEVWQVAVIGRGDGAATARAGALVITEAARQPAHGYAGGEFRHGPLEQAGPGLAALVLGDPVDAVPRDRELRLIADLVDAGSVVLCRASGGQGTFGDQRLVVPMPGRAVDSALARMLGDAVALQLVSVALAEASGLEPGRFVRARKITDVL